MTPHEISILLTIHTTAEPFHPSTEIEQMCCQFKDEGLLDYAAPGAVSYKSTDRLKAYVEFLCAMPLPIAAWQLPDGSTPGTIRFHRMPLSELQPKKILVPDCH